MDSIEVSDSLTIGGAPPLKQDAIDKLQDQIIAPRQDIYVNADYGSDETGDGSAGNPYETLDKAVTAIKPTIPSVYLWLINNKPDLEYTCSVINFNDIDYAYIGVTDGTNLMINNYRAKIKVKYGKSVGGQKNVDGVLKQSYYFGTTFVRNVKELRLVGLDITVEDGFDDETKYEQILFMSVNKLSIGRTFITANRILLFNQATNSELGINDVSSYNLGTKYLVTGNQPVSSIDDPVTNPGTKFFPAENRALPAVVFTSILIEGLTEQISGGIDPKSAKALYSTI